MVSRRAGGSSCRGYIAVSRSQLLASFPSKRLRYPSRSVTSATPCGPGPSINLHCSQLRMRPQAIVGRHCVPGRPHSVVDVSGGLELIGQPVSLPSPVGGRPLHGTDLGPLRDKVAIAVSRPVGSASRRVSAADLNLGSVGLSHDASRGAFVMTL